MEYIKTTSRIVNNYRNAIATAQTEYAEWKKTSDKYTNHYKAKKNAEFERAIADARRQGIAELNKALTLFITEQKDIDILDTAKLTEDTKLLESNFTLPKETLQAIFDKNSGNRTMQQLAISRAVKDGILLERIFYTAQDIINAARDYSYWPCRAIKEDLFYDSVWSKEELRDLVIPDELRGIG